MGSPSAGAVVDVVNARSGRSRSVGSSAERALVPKPPKSQMTCKGGSVSPLEALITDSRTPGWGTGRGTTNVVPTSLVVRLRL